MIVLDTGSADNIVKKLKEFGVNVESKIISPWRFDVARNESLKLVPLDTDVCVCCDIDEIFEKGWREKLEKVWTKGVTRLAYNYNWSLDEFDNPLVNFYIQKIRRKRNAAALTITSLAGGTSPVSVHIVIAQIS